MDFDNFWEQSLIDEGIEGFGEGLVMRSWKKWNGHSCRFKEDCHVILKICTSNPVELSEDLAF